MSESSDLPNKDVTNATTKVATGEPPPDLRTPVPIPRPPLDQIGNYRLVRQLGTGGMGEVWLAQHVDNQNLQSAVKFIRPDHVDAGIHGRFQHERESLVRLRHENIVKVYDLGVTATGLPYFVMEYVDGAPLDVYCDTHQLSVHRRLELFLQVCKAVQHAHGQGLIHRDLKPANILVTDVEEKGGVRAVAKVIDFGIARAMESGDAVDADGTRDVSEINPLLTQTGMFIGSLLYASPEQLLTQPVDIRTDVYSLGSILYQLLSGTLPVTIKEAQAMLREAKAQVLERHSNTTRTPPSDKVRTVGKTDPQKLAKLAEARGVLAEDLAALLVHELDWITLKAIEPERERRYGSVEAFAADLERYLNDEIVEARKPDWKYRAGKKWRRNHRQITIVTLIFVALIAALFTVRKYEQRAGLEAAQTEDQRRRTEEQRKLAQEYEKKAEQERKEAEAQKANAEAAAEREKAFLASFALPTNGDSSNAKGDWTLYKFDDGDYVPLENVGAFYGLGSVIRDNATAKFEFGARTLQGAAESTEFFINRLKFILSYPLIQYRQHICISRMDLTKIIEPVLRPQKIGNAEKIDTIILDPGGDESDEIIKSAYGAEKDFTLDVANRTRLLLLQDGYKVVMTRTADALVPEEERIRIANLYANALFISIHFSSEDSKETGIQTYALAPRGVPSTGDKASESDLQVCYNNINDAQNIALATAVHASLIVRSRMYDRGIKRARFPVIRDITIPGVLFEGGVLSNDYDARLIATPAYRQQTAACILQAVQNYRRAVGTRVPDSPATSATSIPQRSDVGLRPEPK